MAETKPADLFKTDDPRAFWTADCYDCEEDAERLTASDPDEAVAMWLDRLDVTDKFPTVTVWAFKRNEIGKDLDAGRVLEEILERLDEEHGDPDEATEPSRAMTDAAKLLCDTIRAEYRVWSCAAVAHATVDAEAWCRANAPEWLEQISKAEAPRE
jgi:hypothetical protein